MEQRDEEMGRREENRGPERASESEEIDRTLEQIMDNQKQEKKKRPGKKKWILAAGILGLGILGIKMVSTGGSQTPVVAVIPLEKQDIQEKLSISGPVSGTDSVDVVSNIHAEILQMNVKEGDKVIKGQVLAVLDRTELEREVNIARNAYEQAVANKEAQDKEAALGYEKAVQDFQKASTDHDRNSQLFAAGDISQADMEQSANALNDARRAMEKYTVENGRGVSDRSYGLQVENAAYELEKKQEELEKTEIKSEIDGTVVRVNSKVGQFADKVEDDKPIFSIENLDQLELEVKISEFSIGKVKEGQKALIGADILNGKKEEGEVIKISPTGEEKGGGSTERVIPTIIRVNTPDTKLMAGITARAELLVRESKDAFAVPVSAVFDSGEASYIEIVENGKICWIPVTIGADGETKVEVLPADGTVLQEGMAVMGHSGSGKSTLMNILGCLDRPTLGHYYLDGVDTADMTPDQLSEIRNRKIGFVFQSFNLISRTSALKNVELPMTYARIPRAARIRRARELLVRVGLEGRMDHFPNELSGGQRQRVAIARALANEPPLILADEPTGNLDTASSIEIMELFTKLYQEGATVVLVTHEEDIAAFARRIICFGDGKILSDRINHPVWEKGDGHVSGKHDDGF